MNRRNALTIQLENWMLEPEFLNLIPIYEIEATETAAQRGEIPRIWMKEYDEYIFHVADGRPMNILKNLNMWFDDGEMEVKITEENWQEYNCLEFYRERRGTYDLDDAELD